jgi:hypothetical protein
VTVDGVPNDATGLDDIPDDERGGPPPVRSLPVDRASSDDPAELAESVPTMNEYADNHLPLDDPSNSLNDEEIADVREAHEKLFDRADDQIAEAVVNNTVAVSSTNDPMRGRHGQLMHQEYNQDGSHIRIPNGDGESITIHETAHAIHSTFGYETDSYTAGNEHFVEYDEGRLSDDPMVDYMLSPGGRGSDNTPTGFGEWEADVRDEVEGFEPGEAMPTSDNQDIIGDSTGESVNEKMRSLISATNRAFYKMQLANKEHDREGVREMVIKDGYSMKAANETFTMMHEVMNTANGARAIGEVGKLVDHHPELVNAYLNLYDPSSEIADELERRGVL